MTVLVSVGFFVSCADFADLVRTLLNRRGLGPNTLRYGLGDLGDLARLATGPKQDQRATDRQADASSDQSASDGARVVEKLAGSAVLWGRAIAAGSVLRKG